MAEHQIDPETVMRCIEALRTAPGVYRERLPYTDNYFDTITIDNAVTTLEGLLPPPEKSDAETLVDEWLQRNGETSEVFINGYYSEHVALAQFVLDRVSEQLTFPSVSGVTVSSITDAHALNDTPRYVYGPWIERHDSECPVPGDWDVQWLLSHETKDKFKPSVNRADSLLWDRSSVIITHYRVRFEVGKWYDWTGGPCPVDLDTEVQVRFHDSTHRYKGNQSEARYFDWHHGSANWGGNIIAFKVVPE